MRGFTTGADLTAAYGDLFDLTATLTGNHAGHSVIAIAVYR